MIMARNSLSNVCFFTLRDPLKQKVRFLIFRASTIQVLTVGGETPHAALHIVADFISGGVLGASISTIFYPMNVVKNHMQSKVCTLLLSFVKFCVGWSSIRKPVSSIC